MLDKQDSGVQPDVDPYIHQLESDMVWFPDGQYSSDCQNIGSEPVVRPPEATTGVAYVIRVATDTEGRPRVQYASPE